MMESWAAWVVAAPAAAWFGARARARWRLSRAKHRSLQGHARWSKRLARLVPFYEYDAQRFFACDEAPEDIVAAREEAFHALAARLHDRAPRTIAATDTAEPLISDLQFVGRYRVPFQFSRIVRAELAAGAFLQASTGVTVTDLDGNVSYDLAGSYGVNVFGYDVYRACVDAGIARVGDLGPVLGSYHPVVEDNARRICDIAGLDEVSFHMSGTEAVMQAVRLARYHTRRTHVVQFCGAYHGWWDGVQPGIGNPGVVRDVYLLKEMDEATLVVLRTRHDIACVLVNPLQALHPNSGAPGDGTLIAADRRAAFDKQAYAAWLRQLREVCSARGIVLIFDEVFLGFRLARGGAQEYFGVRADMVTYGKTLGGGLPVGVLCGRRDVMRRFRPDRPSDICFARGTFNAHPYVMAAMNEFLHRLDEPGPDGTPPLRESYAAAEATWTRRFAALNARLEQETLPVRVAHLMSIATVLYTEPSRFNWLFQFYLRAHGLALSWVGSGRLIFSHAYTDADFAAVADRFVAAAHAMREGGWWWCAPGTTNAAVRRRVTRELLRARLWRSPADGLPTPHAVRSSSAAES
jgi:glutamate-1-semialdehyde 2,1-aminomutase